MQYDYLIVGQGLAGTVLSHTLMARGHKVLVADEHQGAYASQVAAGLFNPITGRKMVKTWQADLLFPALFAYYTGLEKQLQQSFFFQKDIFVPFDSLEKQNDWLANSSDPTLAPYLRSFSDGEEYEGAVKAPHGGMYVTQSGHVDLPVLLSAWGKVLEASASLVRTAIDPVSVSLHSEGVSWQGITARKLIFCDGNTATLNHWFSWLPFRPVKGEVLLVNFEGGWPFMQIVNKGCWVLPIGTGLCKVGATYNNQQPNAEPTEAGREYLEERLRALVKRPYQIVQHMAGIRPATYDRRPFIGLHPKYPQLGLFNGLGAKGVSLAPFFASQFADFLAGQQQLMPEVALERVFKKFPELRKSL